MEYSQSSDMMPLKHLLKWITIKILIHTHIRTLKSLKPNSCYKFTYITVSFIMVIRLSVTCLFLNWVIHYICVSTNLEMHRCKVSWYGTKLHLMVRFQFWGTIIGSILHVFLILVILCQTKISIAKTNIIYIYIYTI